MGNVPFFSLTYITTQQWRLSVWAFALPQWHHRILLSSCQYIGAFVAWETPKQMHAISAVAHISGFNL